MWIRDGESEGMWIEDAEPDNMAIGDAEPDNMIIGDLAESEEISSRRFRMVMVATDWQLCWFFWSSAPYSP